MIDATDHEADQAFETRRHRLVVLRRAQRILNWICMGAAAIVVFYTAPRLESLLYPVVPLFDVSEIVHQPDGSATIRGVMIKAHGRDHCIPESITAYTAEGDLPAQRIQIDFEPIDDDRPHRWEVRPAGAQTFGPWRLHRPIPPIGPVVRIQVTHRCHALWGVTQILYDGPSADLFPAIVQQ